MSVDPLEDANIGWRPYLVAVTPGTDDELGPIPYPEAWNVNTVIGEVPTLTIFYSYAVDDVHYDMLREQPDVKIVVPFLGGTLFEPHLCRFRYAGFDRDRMDELDVIRFDFLGAVDFALSEGIVRNQTVQDEKDGPVRLTRQFPPTPGETTRVGKILHELVEEEQLTGWAPWLDLDFSNTLDSLGETWPEIPRQEFGLELSLDQVVEQLRPFATFVPRGNSLQAYIPGTFGRDLTETDPVIILDADELLAAPWKKDPTQIVDRVRVVGKDGLVFEFEREDAELPHGHATKVLKLDVDTEGAAEEAAEAYLDAHVHQIEQHKRSQELTRCRRKPWRDYRLEDQVLQQRGRVLREGGLQNPFMDVPVRGISIAEQGGSSPSSVVTLILGDRHEEPATRQRKRAIRETQGTGGGFGGPLREPRQKDDPRIPDLPAAAPTITATTYADHANRIRGRITIAQTWLSEAAASTWPGSDRTAGVVALDRWEWQWKVTGGKWQTVVTDADDGVIPLVLERFDPDDTIKVRRRSVTHAERPSAWSSVFADVTFPADLDPTVGQDLVLDAGHTNADIRALRAANAGAGFAFDSVSSEYVAAFTTTSPTLNYGIGGKPFSGRMRVRPGNVLVIDGEIMKPAGTTVEARFQVRTWDASGTGTTTNVTGLTAVAATGSYVLVSGTFTVPSGAVRAAVQVKAQTLTGTGAKLRVRNVGMDVQRTTNRIGVDQVTEDRQATGSTSTRVLADDGVTEVKQATGSTSTRVLANLAVTNGKTGDDAQDPRTVGADAIETVHLSSGLDIEGVITTGSGLTLGGISAADVDFPSGAAIGDSGGGGLTFQGGDVSFPADVNVIGTVTDGLSARSSKVAVKPISIDQAKALLALNPMTFKYRDSVIRERTKRVIPERVIPERWEKDPDRPGKKRRAKERRIPARTIPGRVDSRRHAGLFADDLADAGLEEVITRAEDGTPDGIQYAKLTPYLLRLIQDLYERVDEISGTDPTR